MTTNVEVLGERRAVNANDATRWTVEEALRWTLGAIERGEIQASKMVIAMAGPDDSYPFVVAGTASRLEVAGLLAQHLRERTE